MAPRRLEIANELFIIPTVAIGAFSYLVACVLIKTNPTVANFLAVMIFTAALNSFNNYFDIAEDMLSKPTRPLPSQKINPKKTAIFTGILLVLSVVISYENRASFGIMLFWALLAILYSVHPIRMKKMPIVSTALITSNYILLPWLLAWSQNGAQFPIVLVVLFFIIGFGSVISKDFEDRRADSLVGNRTIPIILGTEKAILLVSMMTIGGMFVLMGYLVIYSLFASMLCLPAIIGYIYANKKLKNNNEDKMIPYGFMFAGTLSLIPLITL